MWLLYFLAWDPSEQIATQFSHIKFVLVISSFTMMNNLVAISVSTFTYFRTLADSNVTNQMGILAGVPPYRVSYHLMLSSLSSHRTRITFVFSGLVFMKLTTSITYQNFSAKLWAKLLLNIDIVLIRWQIASFGILLICKAKFSPNIISTMSCSG